MLELFHKWFRIPYFLHVRKIRKTENPSANILFLHGLGDTAEVWQPFIDKLPEDVDYISLDLLGFGESPKPKWKTYDITSLIKAVRLTCIRLGYEDRQLIVVGHSLGALVGIAFASRYPLHTQSLILCSPPIYKLKDSPLHHPVDSLLNHIYADISRHPKELIRLYAFAQKSGLAHKTMSVTHDNISSFIATLQTSIMHQQAIDDLPLLKMPITIINGVADPLVIKANIKSIVRQSPHIKLINVLGTHAISGAYAKRLMKTIDEHIIAADLAKTAQI